MITDRDTLANEQPLAGLTDDWDAAAKYLPIFIDEAQRTLDDILEILLAGEAGNDCGIVGRLFVAAHCLKGSAASIGLHRVAKLAHLTEDLLQGRIDDGRALTPDVSDAILQFADGLRKYIECLKEGHADSFPLDTLAQTLAAVRNRARPRGTDAAADATGSRESLLRPALPEAPMPIPRVLSVATGIAADVHRRIAATVRADQYATTLAGVVVFDPNWPLVGLKARLVYEKLANVGAICCFEPPIEEVENREQINSVCFGIVTEKSAEQVGRLVHSRRRPWRGRRAASHGGRCRRSAA